jgi:magnesium-transporting ATPase (P-type)
VTNGIQDVALAFEPGEPGVLERPPRPPTERIFNRIMIERTLLAGVTFAILGLASWTWWLEQGMSVPEARNLLVQLFVLFEIMHIGNARSENVSMFRLNPFRNPVLLLGTLGALGIHLAALHLPFFQGLLGISPIPWDRWLTLALSASVIVLVMEVHKKLRSPPAG